MPTGCSASSWAHWTAPAIPNDTAEVLLSDHGEWGGDHGLVEKWPSACDGVRYYPKVALQNQHPETVTRATSIRTTQFKLVLRPAGQNELYDLANDPRELHNVYGDRLYAPARGQLSRQMLDWYIHTADVAPGKHNPHGFPQSPK